jgi:putative ABC transport system substrate-binding protein
MRRRDFIVWLGAATTPSIAYAQRTTVPRIGLLDPGIRHLFDAFMKGMSDLGYVEGQTVSYVWRSGEGRPDRLAAYAAELVQLKVDVIVTAGPPPVQAAMNATATIPIVLAAHGDVVGWGVVKSLARPGGNVTGLSFLNAEVSAKRLELLHEAVPQARRVAILFDKVASKTFATEDAASKMALQATAIGVAGPEELEGAFEVAIAQRTEIIDVLASPFFNSSRVGLTTLAAKYRLPAMYESSEYVTSGGLMSYGPDLAELFRRAATYVDKILKGARPGDLPIEQPTKFELAINLKTAKALGLIFPPSILARADEVIE